VHRALLGVSFTFGLVCVSLITGCGKAVVGESRGVLAFFSFSLEDGSDLSFVSLPLSLLLSLRSQKEGR